MSTELKTNTAVRITVGPFLDKTDGITPEVALTVTSCHLTLIVDNAGVPTLVLDANATASAGNNDMVHVTDDDAGYYDLELTAAQLNYLGNAKLSINDVATHLPVFHEIEIVSAQYWDAKYGTGNFKADMDTIKTQAVTCAAGVTVLASVGTAATSTAQTGDSYPLVSTEVAEIYAAVITNAAGVDIAADIVAVKADTAAILTDTGTTLDGRIPAALVGGRMDASVGAVAAGAITAAGIADAAIDAATFAAGAINAAAIADSAIDRATFAADTGLQSIRSNTAQAGAAGSITLDAGASATTDFYVGAIILLTGGTGVGQVRFITAYNGTTKVATIVPNWATAPDVTSTFAIISDAYSFLAATTHTGAVVPTVTTLTGHTAQTGDSFARLGAPAGASVSADIAAIEAQTDDIGAAGAGLTAVPWNATWDAEVQSEVFDALDAAFTDATGLTANGLLDRMRTLGWIQRNKIAVTDLNGNTVIYKDDSTTAAFTVNGMLTDDSTTTTRLRAA